MADAPATNEAPFLPLSVPVIAGNEWAYVKECLDTGWVSTSGAFVGRFEERMRSITGAKHAVACQSGTAALHVSLRLLGVGHGDVVVVPTLTFIASVNAIAYTGARPVFCDSDEWMNLDPRCVEKYLNTECERTVAGHLVDRATRRRVAAILAVHVFGIPADMAGLKAVADEFGLPIVEDAAESLGSSWTAGPLAGRHTGTIGKLGCFSFNGNKVVTCGGGGCIVTDDDELAAQARHLTTTAKIDAARFIHDDTGYNYRLTNLAAALGLAQLEQLDTFIARKRENHARYAEALHGVPGVRLMGVPEGVEPNYWFYSLLIEPDDACADRENVMARLRAHNIESRPLWELNHRQLPYAHDRMHCADRAGWFWERVLNVPCSSDLTADDVERVAAVVRCSCTGT